MQDYAGGKIFYSPATGAHAVTGAILTKYEAQGGPTGDLGLPTGTEADGGAPNSRVSAFSAADKPVIFWTPDNGAIVVRGAINAAWAKLGGAGGKLGVPTGEQSANGDTVTQKFSGGEISWNKAANKFTTKPPELARTAGRDAGAQRDRAAGGSAAPTSGKGFTWHWWWLLIIIPALLLVAVIALGLLWLQRRRGADIEVDDDFHDSEYDDDDDHWPGAMRVPRVLLGGRPLFDVPRRRPRAGRPAPGLSWAQPGGEDKSKPGPEDVFDGDQDSIDTTPTRIPAEPADSDETDEAEAAEVPVEHEYAEIEESRRSRTPTRPPIQGVMRW